MSAPDMMTVQMEQFQRHLFLGARGETTSAGNIGGTTLIDTARTEVNDFWNDHFSIKILSGANIGEIRQIIDFDAASDTITVDRAFTAQVASGVGYIIRADPYSIQGANSANNLVDTTAVAHNIDGSIVERTESVLKALKVVAAAGTGFEEDGTGATLYDTVVGYEGLTTSAGTTTTIVDTVLGAFAADHWNGSQVMMLENNSAGVVRTIVDFDGTDTLTLEPALPVASSDASAYIILPCKSSDWIVGANNADNAYDSSAVVINSDGSVLERLEHILVALGGTTGTTTSIGTTTTAIDTARTETADYWNGGVFICVDGTNAGLARPIYDFNAGTDTLYFEPAFPNLVASGVNYLILTRYDTARLIGADNADNAIDTSTVDANKDGSLLERNEWLYDIVGNFTGPHDGVEIDDNVKAITDVMRDTQTGGGTIYFVGSGGNDGNTGTSWGQRRLTVASGYGLLSASDALIIGSGIFTEDINFNTDGCTVIGAGSGDGTNAGTVISGHSTMTCMGNHFENLDFTDSDGIVIVIGNDANANYNEFKKCSIVATGTATSAIHFDGTNGGDFSTIDDCYIAGGTSATILMDTGAVTDNLIKNCHILTDGSAGHGIHINHASAVENIINRCVVIGKGTTGTGIYIQAGADNRAVVCTVDDCTTLYNIAATNYAIGCHEPFTNINATASSTLDDIFQIFATLWAADGANTFNPTIDGVARTDLETAFEAIDSLISEIGGTALRGTVTTYTSATEFASTDLTGYGDDAFEGWYVCVLESDGAAPQMELPERISAYTSATGVFTHTAFDSGILATDDEVLIIHPSVYMAMLSVFEHKIHFDDTNGIAGTYYPIGTPMMPSSNEANSKTIADNLLFNKFQIKGSFTIPATMQGYYFAGDNPINISDLVGFNTQDVDGSTFQNLVISGVQAGTVGLGTQIFCIDCFAIAVSGFNGTLDRCMVSTTLGLAAGAYAQFTNCSFGVNVATTITLGTPAKCDFYGFKGNATLAGLTGGTGAVNIWLQDGATITIDNTNTGNTINVYGNGIVTDNNGGTTVNNYTLDALIGGFTGDGGADQNDSIKASLDLAHTDLDAILASVEPDLGGVALYGIVTTATSDTQVKVAGLAGKGTNAFNDRYYCHIIEADNVAPEGETRKISAYDTSDGDITVSVAFSVAPDVGDQILILHESLALMFMHADATLTSVIDDSIIAHILAADGDVSAYDDTTMSLEALNVDLDAIIVGVITNATGADVATDVVALQADVGNPTARANLTTIESMLGNPDTANCYVYGAIGDEYVNANGNPDVDNIRAHLRAGLVNGTGTVLPANTSLYDVLTDGTAKNIMINRDMPYLTEFWEDEVLDAQTWEETLDGGGTGLWATSGGYMYYDIDTGAVGDEDVFLNSKYRWQVRPGTFGDSNTILGTFHFQAELQFVTAVGDHDNTHFFVGLSATKSNDITNMDLIGFYLDTDNLKGKTDSGGTESTTGTIAATLTNWNLFEITITQDSVVFSLNGTAETAITTNIPDIAQYLIIGTRAEAAVGVGINISNVRVFYEEA